jgi:hypothetical protein
MLLSAIAIAVRRKEQGRGKSARLEIRHAVRRSLEDEGRHTRKGRGGGTLTRSADLVGLLNPYGPRWASPLASGF